MEKEKFIRRKPTINIGEIVKKRVVITPQNLATTKATFAFALQNEREYNEQLSQMLEQNKDTIQSESPKTYTKK